MKLEQPLQFYPTGSFPCPYLTGKTARNGIVFPEFDLTTDVYSRLLQMGFRRSGEQLYRPYCDSCKECISTRIPVQSFTPNRSQRRNWKANQDLRIEINSSGFRQEYIALYEAYLISRHDDMDPEGISDFLSCKWHPPEFVEFHDNKKLLGVATIDVLAQQAVSAVYTFFDPEHGSRRGLGTFAVLWEIEYAKQLGIPYVYPGYWIRDCRKMNYKTRFQPLEGYQQGEWMPVSKK